MSNNWYLDYVDVVGYCRVSTGSDEQKSSFKSQQEFFEDFVKEHGLKLVKTKGNNNTGIYTDKGISGTKLKREGFAQMLLDAGLKLTTAYEKSVVDPDIINKAEYDIPTGAKPLFHIILVKDTSRFARTLKVAQIYEDLKKLGVFVYFMYSGMCTCRETDYNAILASAQQDALYSRELSGKMLLANKQTRKNHVLRANHLIYGYDYTESFPNKDKRKLTAKPSEALVVQTIFRVYAGCFTPDFLATKPTPMPNCEFRCDECEVYLTLSSKTGVGVKVLGRYINDICGYRTRKGVPFCPTVLKRMLDNEKYAGFVNSGKLDHGTLSDEYSYGKIREGYEDFLCYKPEQVEPLVSIELMMAVKAKRNEQNYHSRGRFIGKPSKYNGLLYCAKCDSVFLHNFGTDKNHTGFYCCKTKKRQGKEQCDNGNVLDWQIEQFIDNLAQGLLPSLLSEVIQKKLEKLKKQLVDSVFVLKQNSFSDLKEQLNKVKVQIEQRTQGLSALYDIMASGTADIEILKKTITNKEVELIELKQEGVEIEAQVNEPKEHLRSILNVIEKAIQTLTKMKEKYTVEEVMSYIERVYVLSIPQTLNGSDKAFGTPKPQFDVVFKFEVLASEMGLNAVFKDEKDFQGTPFVYLKGQHKGYAWNEDLGFSDKEARSKTNFEEHIKQLQKKCDTYKDAALNYEDYSISELEAIFEKN